MNTIMEFKKIKKKKTFIEYCLVKSKKITIVNGKTNIDINMKDDKFSSFMSIKKKLEEKDTRCDFKFDNYDILVKYHNKVLCFMMKSSSKVIGNDVMNLSEAVDTYKREIYFYKGKQIKVSIDDNSIAWFDLNEISSILGYSTGSSLRYYIRTYNIPIKKISRHTCVDSHGLINILMRLRKPESTELFDDLDLCEHDDIPYKKVCLEAEILKHVQEYLEENEIKWKLQHKIGNYYVDMYIPEHKIAIEVDEMGHSGYSKSDEVTREEYIKKKLTKNILRINPNENNFRIAKELGKLNKLILNSLKTL